MSYLKWKSQITLEDVFASTDKVLYPQYCQDGIAFLSDQVDLVETDHYASADRRWTLYFQNHEQLIRITPEGFEPQTKINEYGGKPFWVIDDQLYFCNLTDQAVYRQVVEEGRWQQPDRITGESNTSTSMFADLCRLPSGALLAIRELHQRRGGENQLSLVYLPIGPDPQNPINLETGSDFYASLSVDQAGGRVAWIEWQHPNMPWDANQLWVADIDESGGHPAVVNKRRVPLDQGASACQLVFANNGQLFFAADFPNQAADHSGNFWNIYRYDPQLKKDPQQVTQLDYEFGYPHWQYGDERIAQYDDSHLIAVGSKASGDALFMIHQETLKVEQVLTNQVDGYQQLATNRKGRAVFQHLSQNREVSITELRDQDLSKINLSLRTKQSSVTPPIAEHISFDSEDGLAHAFFYQPVNDQYQSEGPPPLIVMVHGGPTAWARGFYDVQKQFWTQNGFALVDVNHRGSCGYGRAFRDALLGHWGERDVADVANAVKYLIDQDRVNGDQVCIRGKSAGGYAVLCALTKYPSLFKAGACYYGIGNLKTLAESTHKFEKHYTDGLIGEAYNAERAGTPDSRYFKRSPINFVDQLQSPMIIFQGLKDKVVPPAVAQEMVNALKEANISHSYVEYPEEAHGFRQINNNIDAWSKELAFYREVLE